MSGERGTVVTFYSFKGGVGRTMALANIAVVLATQGKKVLVVDFDLEAPGLDRYFGDLRPAGEPAAGGLVELLLAHRDGKEPAWRDHTVSIEVGGEQRVVLMPAGSQDEDYAGRVLELDWKAFFADRDGGAFFEALREEWLAAFDLVLVDSRTGLTDAGGICTVLLPDVLVPVFTSNNQSLEGARDVVLSAQEARQELAYDRAPLLVCPLPSRFEGRVEVEESRRWLDNIVAVMGPFYRDWLPDDRIRGVVERMKIPHIAKFSFGESLPVLTHGTTDPDLVGFWYATVASMMLDAIARRVPEVPKVPFDAGAPTDDRYDRLVRKRAAAWVAAEESDSLLLAGNDFSDAVDATGNAVMVAGGPLRFLTRSIKRELKRLRQESTRAFAVLGVGVAIMAAATSWHLRQDDRMLGDFKQQLEQTAADATSARKELDARKAAADEAAKKAQEAKKKANDDLERAQQELDKARGELTSATGDKKTAEQNYQAAFRTMVSAKERATSAEQRADAAEQFADAAGRAALKALADEQRLSDEVKQERAARETSDAALAAEKRRGDSIQASYDQCTGKLKSIADELAGEKGGKSACDTQLAEEKSKRIGCEAKLGAEKHPLHPEEGQHGP